MLLTVDGGTSIGKPVLFKHEDDYAVDSHVAILRPKGIAPGLLVYLLASPIGQLQFQRAESGASGQTAVTEDDIRRFRFPSLDPKEAEVAVAEMRHTMERIAELQGEISRTEREGWERFESRLDGA